MGLQSGLYHLYNISIIYLYGKVYGKVTAWSLVTGRWSLADGLKNLRRIRLDALESSDHLKAPFRENRHVEMSRK